MIRARLYSARLVLRCAHLMHVDLAHSSRLIEVLVHDGQHYSEKKQHSRIT